MSFLSSFFSADKNNSNGLKLQFIKEEKIWHVLSKGCSIMYMGNEESCKTYMKNMQAAA